MRCCCLLARGVRAQRMRSVCGASVSPIVIRRPCSGLQAPTRLTVSSASTPLYIQLHLEDVIAIHSAFNGSGRHLHCDTQIQEYASPPTCTSHLPTTGNSRLTLAVALKVSRTTPPVLRRRAPESTLLSASGLHGDGTLQRRAGREPADGGADGGVWRGARLLLRVRARLGPPTHRMQARRGMAQERTRGRRYVAVDQGEYADVPELQEQHREGGRVQVRSSSPSRSHPLSADRIVQPNTVQTLQLPVLLAVHAELGRARVQ